MPWTISSVRWRARPKATFGLHRFSLTQFAARLAIVKLATAGVTPSSAVGAEALAVRAAYEAATRNELPYFAPVTKFPGFARATAPTLGELRASGVAAEKLEALEEAGSDHAALLERYQDQMEEVSVADRTILFQTALEEVRAGADLARHPLLLMDVPIHSTIERAFLLELASAAFPRCRRTSSRTRAQLHSCSASFGCCPFERSAFAIHPDCSGGRAMGSCHPRRMAINRSPKQRTAPAIATPEAGRCSVLPSTTTAAPISAATA